MNRPLTALTTAAFALLLLWPGAVSADDEAPLAVVHGFIAAMNASNAPAALALFADDGLIRTGRRAHSGKTEVSYWLEEHAGLHMHMAVRGNPGVEGEKVVWTADVSRDDWERLGVSPVETSYEAVVQQGRIRSLSFVFNPEAEAKLRAAQAGARDLALRAVSGEPGPAPAAQESVHVGTVLIALALGIVSAVVVLVLLARWRAQQAVGRHT